MHRTIVIIALSLLTAIAAQPAEARQNGRSYPQYGVYDRDLPQPSFFRKNRERLAAAMGDSSALVLFAAPERQRNGDVDYRYRQDNDFFYLTGCNEPNAALLLSNPGMEVKDSTGVHVVHEALLVQSRVPAQETWTGRRMGPEGAQEMLGIERGASNAEFSLWLRRATRQARVLYLPLEAPATGGRVGAMAQETYALARTLESSLEVRSPLRLIGEMRTVKAADEIAMIRRAVAISSEGHRRMMRACKPGVYEYQLQAEFESAVAARGAEYVAYPCIVGSGENSVILHYQANRKMLAAGELVVADCAAEYHNYASDITRTLPVSGTFTAAQKEIYAIVLRAQLAAIDAMKPGVAYTPSIERAAQEVIRDGLLGLGIIHDSASYRKFFIHGLGHPVGLDTHDIYGDRILREGEIWTVEPGIYIPAGTEGVDERYWNVGVRIEDDVLITADGHEVLSADVPKEIRDVERAMRSSGR